MQEVISAIRKAKSAIILTHMDPDGDAIGSMIAMHLVLKDMGKRTAMYCRDPVPEIYRMVYVFDHRSQLIHHFPVAFLHLL